ncbi:MAG TPA: GNAT family N-acetyltransferase [Ilumatobacteraceae bacterium]|nr:GNAT family N-acetyltransferase [Ilumatobacteraceae bacterium]
MDRLPETIASERLTLRRWVPDDAPALCAAVEHNLDHLRPWMPWIVGEPKSIDARVALINQWAAEWERGGDVVLGVLLDDVVVGSTGLHRRRGPTVLEIGYWVHRDHTRNGIATELSAALTTAAFTVPGIDRVEIHHDKANEASGGIPRRLGFTRMEETPVAITSPGEVGLDCRWQVTREDWARKLVAPTD